MDFGAIDATLAITQYSTAPTLDLEINERGYERHIRLANVLRLHRWCHLAVVSGSAGTCLYFDGMLVGTNGYAGGFAQIGSGEHNYVGYNNWALNNKRLPTFHG